MITERNIGGQMRRYMNRLKHLYGGVLVSMAIYICTCNCVCIYIYRRCHLQKVHMHHTMLCSFVATHPSCAVACFLVVGGGEGNGGQQEKRGGWQEIDDQQK